MFYYLEGLVALLAPNLAVLDIGGVGYACLVTTNTLAQLESGKKARLYTYCNIKEDAFDIYGFVALSEKRCFELLISVSGVGPKAALSILSSCSPESFALAVIGDDERTLMLAPGVGKKLAQRVILELKDKISKETAALMPADYTPASHTQGHSPGAVLLPEIVTKQRLAADALAVLGYTQPEISAAMRSIDIEPLTVEEIIKKVLMG